MSVTAYAEARGEGVEGMALVVESLLQRKQMTGQDACSIANRYYDGFKLMKRRPSPAKTDTENWIRASAVTALTVNGAINLGSCSGATHFYRKLPGRRAPYWAKPEHRVCKLGNHIAYRYVMRPAVQGQVAG
ncbi:cell wall hydrolase [Dyella telluris]|uniref:Cell wall hydrolase n=1 Tax=Dyella telluris TaxID=2763498 RepID=A0A7G8Q4H5_9GAMM|nr:cell wall hydrolase [Dyella telluris]QNK01683.1 cell wall hydrolase [Dyella telluris]